MSENERPVATHVASRVRWRWIDAAAAHGERSRSTSPLAPPPTTWDLPRVEMIDDEVGDLVAVGADLEPGTILAAYRQGLFPMHVSGMRMQLGARRDWAAGPPIGWWSPHPRAVIPHDQLHVSKSLDKSCRRFTVTADIAFREVMTACANPKRPHGWIDRRFIDAYTRLHELGWAHSIEVWNDSGHLVGGLYGIAIGGFFAGESMFHHERDASKVALVALVERQVERGAVLLDVQWSTPHLVSLGAVEVSRREYLVRLAGALERPTTPFAPDLPS